MIFICVGNEKRFQLENTRRDTLVVIFLPLFVVVVLCRLTRHKTRTKQFVGPSRLDQIIAEIELEIWNTDFVYCGFVFAFVDSNLIVAPIHTHNYSCHTLHKATRRDNYKKHMRTKHSIIIDSCKCRQIEKQQQQKTKKINKSHFNKYLAKRIQLCTAQSRENKV